MTHLLSISARLVSSLAVFLLAALPLAVSAQEMPVINPEPVPTNTVSQAVVDYEGVRFTFDASLTDRVSVIEYEAAIDNVMIPAPAYTEFTFEGYSEGDYVNYAPMPRLGVYPIADFGDYPYFVEQLDALSALLAERPDLNQYATANPGRPDNVPLPFLPPFNAAQVIRALPEYIDLPTLNGIRYLVYYSQAMNPLTEGEVFYTFQGITRDGQHYVSALLPVNTGTIPGIAPEIANPEAFAEVYDNYLNGILGEITAADPESFNPPLSTLDALVASITVNR